MTAPRPVRSWSHDFRGLAACLAVAGVLRLSAEGFVAVVVVAAACHGWAQTSPQRMAAARRRLPWAIAAVIVAAIVRNSEMEPIRLTLVAGGVAGVVGCLYVRARKRRAKRPPTTNLARRVRERPIQRSAAPSLRHHEQRRRHERYDPDDFEDFEDDWDGDEWDGDEPEYYGGPSGGRRRRAESWETGDADYI